MRTEHWLLCDDCGEGIRECACERTEDHYGANMPHPEWRNPKIFPTLCCNCEHERAKAKPGYKV